MKSSAIKLMLSFYLAYSAEAVAKSGTGLNTNNPQKDSSDLEEELNNLSVAPSSYSENSVSGKSSSINGRDIKSEDAIELTGEIKFAVLNSVKSLKDFIAEKLAKIFPKFYLDAALFYKHSDCIFGEVGCSYDTDKCWTRGICNGDIIEKVVS